jgi:putative PIN family toxin of toxin-antitoxin system
MNTTAVSVVIDSNILIAIIGKKSPFRWIFDCIIQGKIALCVSTEILLEYREILEQKTSEEVAENLVNFITAHPFTEKIEIYYNFQLITQDPDDNKYVDCVITAGALCIVSNDSHFRVLKTIPFPIVTVLTLIEFEKEYRERLTAL